MPYRQRTSFKEVDLLTSPHYEDLQNVSRCLHICDVEDTQRHGMLVLQPIRNSRTLRNATRVLWFAPTLAMDQHNFYGNVSYVISWQTVLDKMGPHLYQIDQAVYGNRAFTRILLTKKNYDVLLRKVDLHSEGSALLKRSHKYVHASKCYCRNKTGEHELQIGIEATEEDARWLYKHCTVMANDHTNANALMRRQITRKDGKIRTYEPYKCFLFNTTLNTQCPNADSRSQTEATLSSMNIAFSRRLPLKRDTDKENVIQTNRSYLSHGISGRTPNRIAVKIDMPSPGFAASTSGVLKPITENVPSHPAITVVPDLSKGKKMPHSTRVDRFSDWGPDAPATSSCHFGNQSHLEPSARSPISRKVLGTQSSTKGISDISNINRAVSPNRRNKLPPIVGNTAHAVVGSISVGSQHGNSLLATDSAYKDHSPQQTSPATRPTFSHTRGTNDIVSGNSSSNASSPVTSAVRNDWSPILDGNRSPHAEPKRRKKSFSKRLLRWIMCC